MERYIKKILFTWAFALIACQAIWAQGYIIQGNVEGLNENDTIELYEVGHNISKPFASTPVRNGQFVFKGRQEDPRGVYILVKNAFGSYHFILDNSNINITGEAKVQTIRNNRSFTWDVKTAGSALTDEYIRKVSVKDSLDKAYKRYHDKYDMAKAKLEKKTKRMKDSVEIKRLQKEIFEVFATDEKVFFTRVENDYNNLFTSNGNSWWGPFLMQRLLSYLTPNMKPIYEGFSDTAKNSYYGKMVKDELYPKDITGVIVPEFTITANGQETTLKQITGKNKYVLIDFWASWCVPCRKEIPNLKKLYTQYADKGFQIVSISIDRDAKAWEKASAEEQLPWLSYLDRFGIADQYKVKLIPYMLLIDHNGKLISDKLRGEELGNKLAELLP